MSLILESKALPVDALSQPWQRSVDVHVSSVSLAEPGLLQTLSHSEVILMTQKSQQRCPHLIQLCFDRPRFFPYRCDLLSQPGHQTGSHTICTYRGSHAAIPSSRRLRRDLQAHCGYMYNNRWLRFAGWDADHVIDLLGPMTSCLKWSCLASVLSHIGSGVTLGS